MLTLNWRRWLIGLSMALLAALAQAAPKVLLLRTVETSAIGSGIVTNALNAFTAAGAVVTERTTLGMADTALESDLQTEKFDLVVVMAVYGTPNAANMDVLRQAALNRTFSALYLSLDTCGNCTPTPKVGFLNAMANALAGPAYPSSIGGLAGSYGNFALNTGGAYSANFTDINPLYAGIYRPFLDVPSDLALYLGTPTVPNPLPPTTSAHHFIVPGSLSNEGRGACAILTSDGSHFGHETVAGSNPPVSHAQRNAGFAAALLAALGSDASCRVPLQTTASLAGLAYDDQNGNGIRDVGEPPLAGVQITATCTAGDCLAAGAVPVSVTTVAGGAFTFNPIANGTWTLSASGTPEWGVTGAQVGTVGGVASGTAAAPDITGVVLSANSGINYLFGLKLLPNVLLAAPATITEGQAAALTGATENAPPGTTVTLVIADGGGNTVSTHTTTTDGSHAYQLSVPGLVAGNYTVTASIPGDPTPAVQTLTVLAPVPVPSVGAWALALLAMLVAAMGSRAARQRAGTVRRA